MKSGYELELLAPPGSNRETLAEIFAREFQLSVKECFHRESELLPNSSDPTPFYCLTKGFELSKSNKFQLRIINDMTIRSEIDSSAPHSAEWFHVLSDDIRFIDLIKNQCDPSLRLDKILIPIAHLFNTSQIESDGVYSVTGRESKLVCAAHGRMSDRSRICEIVTAPIIENHFDELSKIVDLATRAGCVVPKEAAFHIHFDGLAFVSSKNLLRFIRYFYVWSDVLKTLIPPNPNCTRLGEFNDKILSYAFEMTNEEKDFPQVVHELKELGPTKYCDFNFNNILIGNPEKFTVEMRAIPMLLNASALYAASELYSQFLKFICSTAHEYPREKMNPSSENIGKLMSFL